MISFCKKERNFDPMHCVGHILKVTINANVSVPLKLYLSISILFILEKNERLS